VADEQTNGNGNGNGTRHGVAVNRRPLVPTGRQLAKGEQVTEFEFVENTKVAVERKRPGQLLREWARDADPRGIEGPMTPIIVLAAIALIGAWDDVALGVLLPEIRSEFGLSVAFLGALATQLLVVALLVGPPMGYLADRVKRVWLVRVGSILSNLASIGAGVSKSVPQLVGSRWAGGMAKGIQDPAGLPLLTDYYGTKSRARVFAFLFAAGQLGVVIGPTVAGQLGDRFGWRSTLIVLGGLATIVSFGTFFLKEPKRGAQERREMGADDEVAEREQEPVTFAEGWRAARSISTVRRFMYASPILYIGGTGTGLILSLYFAEVFSLGPRERGYLGTLGGCIGLIALVFSGPVTDRLLRDRPGRVLTYLGGAIALQAVAFLGLAFSPNLALSVVLTLPISFAAPLLLPALITLISLVVPPRMRGFGLQSFAWFQLIGVLFFPTLLLQSEALGLRKGMLVFIPFLAIGGIIIASGSGGVQRDIRAAQAAAMAEEEARKARSGGRGKMLVCRDVDVEYDGVQVLFNVDFDMDEGEIVALLGTNGAGKSTLLRAIAGIQEASNGAIFLDDLDITHVPPHENARRGVVMMPGGQATFPALTVADNLRAAVWMNRDDDEFVAARMDEVLGFFPVLRERFDQVAGNLSGGEQQMVGLGQAFLMKPRLLMIDELSLGLAPVVVEQLLQIIREIHQQGTTIILVEQSLNVAMTIAERAVFMEKGEVRFSGRTDDLLARPDLVRSVFMGGGASGGRSAAPARRSADAEQGNILEVSDISLRFGGVHALRGAGLQAAAGEIVGIIGPNGAGKTTLFDVISGFVTADSGSVVIDGTDVTGLSPDARARLGLGRSFQSAKLFPAMTVRENIAVALERKAVKNPLLAAVRSSRVRKSEQRLQRQADGLIELLGLDAFADKFLGELSTGTRRAVDVACIMASDPKVLLLDEPSSGLAQAETEELGPVITRIVRQTGCAAIVIEHDLPLITSVSHRLVAMELGAVVVDGTPTDVVNDKRVLGSYLAASEGVLARSDSRAAALAAALGQDAT
jgi:branched-chain amino acid transport system ATP-binding protein